MIKNKNKYERLKVPMLKSWQNRPSVKPKLQDNISIKPSSGYMRQVDYRFETDEQIQTEQSCKQIISKESEQKRKNSFSKMISQLKQTNLNLPAKEKKRKQFQIFNCDSLAIRPSGNIAVLTNNYASLQLESKCVPIQMATDVESSKTRREEESIIISQKICRLGGSRKNKARKTIFDHKYIQRDLGNFELPTALTPYEIETFASRKEKKKINQQDFHIVFEAEEIVQCCL